MAAGCATGRAFARGEAAGQAGDWEAAVGFYRQALEDDPDRPDYKIALERAMVAAADMYAERGRQFEEAGQLEEALRAYRKAQEFEPSNRQLSARAAQIERTLARSARGGDAAARNRKAAAAGAARHRRADSQPVEPRAADRQLRQHQHPRHPDLRRQLQRHQRHVRSRLPGSHDHAEARRRLARAGAAADHDRQPAVLRGAERSHHHRRRRQHAEAHAVRRAGHPHLLHLACRRDRAVDAADRARARRRHGDPAADRRQQDRPTR